MTQQHGSSYLHVQTHARQPYPRAARFSPSFSVIQPNPSTTVHSRSSSVRLPESRDLAVRGHMSACLAGRPPTGNAEAWRSEPFLPVVLHLYDAVVEDRVYVAHAGPGGAPPDGGANAPAARRVEVAAAGWYKPLPVCDNFGPPCLSVVEALVRRLDAELAAPASAVAVWVEPCRRQATNAVFLARAYAVLRLGQSAAAVAHAVEGLDASHTEPYRDAAYSRPDFGLAALLAGPRARPRPALVSPAPAPLPVREAHFAAPALVGVRRTQKCGEGWTCLSTLGCQWRTLPTATSIS
jgi:hypothetical protein